MQIQQEDIPEGTMWPGPPNEQFQPDTEPRCIADDEFTIVPETTIVS
jgi:hypothetical protein